MAAGRFVIVSLLLLGLACTPASPARDDAKDAALEGEATTQSMDMVDLRLYLRRGRARDAHLVPVIREVPVSDDLPRTALQLLIDGPAPSDPPGVAVTLPPSTRIRRFAVRESTAVVDFSSAIVRDAKAVGRRGEHEFLALTAIANTLTEFPDIDFVKMTVDGRRSDFWGRWGLPELLVRDTTMTEPPTKRLRLAEPEQFRWRGQRVGARRDRPARVTALRVHATAAYLRVTAEISPPGGGNLLGPLPLSTAKRDGRDVVLQIAARSRPALAGSLRGKFRDPAFAGGRVVLHPRRPTAEIRLRPRRDRPFWLHTLSQPARVVLDIRR